MYNKIENIIEDSESDRNVGTSSPNTKQTLSGLIMFLLLSFMITGAAILLVSSYAYRYVMKVNKSAPFEAPRFLQVFFPKPKYDHEINELCRQYIEN